MRHMTNTYTDIYMTASQNKKNEHDEEVPLYDIFQKMLSKHYKQSDPESQKR